MKVVTADNTVDFEKLGALINMEMYIEFSEKKDYVVHYFVNGKEGENYPQSGTFTVNVETETLALVGGVEGTATISLETNLQLGLNGGVTQYYKKHVDANAQ